MYKNTKCKKFHYKANILLRNAYKLGVKNRIKKQCVTLTK